MDIHFFSAGAKRFFSAGAKRFPRPARDKNAKSLVVNGFAGRSARRAPRGAIGNLILRPFIMWRIERALARGEVITYVGLNPLAHDMGLEVYHQSPDRPAIGKADLPLRELESSHSSERRRCAVLAGRYVAAERIARGRKDGHRAYYSHGGGPPSVIWSGSSGAPSRQSGGDR
jgi:hypothetical protein